MLPLRIILKDRVSWRSGVSGRAHETRTLRSELFYGISESIPDGPSYHASYPRPVGIVSGDHITLSHSSPANRGISTIPEGDIEFFHRFKITRKGIQKCQHFASFPQGEAPVRPSFLDKEYLLKYVNRYAYQMPDRPLGEDTGALFDELVSEIACLGQGISKSCYAHNDLSISNILFNGDKLYIIDWVAADEEGLPFVDAFELVLYLVNRRLGSYLRSLKELFTGRIREQSMLKMAAKKYSVDFGLNGGALRWLMRLAIFSKIHRFRSCGRSDRSEELKESFYFLKSIPSAQILPDR